MNNMRMINLSNIARTIISIVFMALSSVYAQIDQVANYQSSSNPLHKVFQEGVSKHPQLVERIGLHRKNVIGSSSPEKSFLPATPYLNGQDVYWDDQFTSSGFDQAVYTMVLSPEGELYAGGVFTTVDGVIVNGIAKWETTGWLPLGEGIDGWVYAIAINGSDIYVGGNFDYAGGIAANNVAKWDGSQWTALGEGFNDDISTLCIKDNIVYAGGWFTEADGNPANYIAQWDGESWSTLGGGVDDMVSEIITDGTDLYVGGFFVTAGAQTVNYLAKWDGSVWSALGGGLDDWANALLIKDSDLYVGGYFTRAGDTPANYVARWNGSDWDSLDVGVNAVVRALTYISFDVYVGGDFTKAGGIEARHIAAWNGFSWSALNSIGTNSKVLSLTTGDGLFINNLYVGGEFTLAGDIVAGRLARYDVFEELWFVLSGSTRDNAVSHSATALAGDNENLYIGGLFNVAGGKTTNRIARWDGSDWYTLGSGLNDYVNDIKSHGSDIYVGGAFTEAGGIAANHIAKWDGTSWSPLGEGVNNIVTVIEIVDDDVYVGGTFSQAGGIEANYIARWDGTNWSALGNGTNGSVQAIVSKDDNLYVGGWFDNAGPIVANNIAKWNSSSWSALGSGVDETVYSITIDENDNIYAGGGFTQAGGKDANYIAMWDGNDWQALGDGLDGFWGVKAIAVCGSDLYVGGGIDKAGQTEIQNIARWDGQNWHSLGSGLTGWWCNDLLIRGSEFFVAGWFYLAGGMASSNIGRWTGLPIITLDQDSLDFGKVAQGFSKKIYLNIKNNGGTLLNINNIDGEKLVFSSEIKSFRVVAGSDTTIEINFSPPDTGIFNDTMMIYTNTLNPASFYVEGIGKADLQMDFDKESVPDTISEGGDVSVLVRADIGSFGYARLFYKEGGKITYDSLAMSPVSENTYLANIPSSVIGNRGCVYYVEVSDGFLTTTAPAEDAKNNPYGIVVKIENGLTKDQQQAVGTNITDYRMISFPVQSVNDTPDSLLKNFGQPNADWTLFRWQDNSYIEQNQENFGNLIAGQSYWFITTTAENLSTGVSYTTKVDREFTIDLQPGWNMLGNPYNFEIAWSDVVKTDNIEDLWELDVSSGQVDYQLAPILKPWEGYFVKNANVNVETIRIPPQEVTGLSKGIADRTRSLEDNEWKIRLKTWNGKLADNHNFIGMLVDAADEYDLCDLPESPRQPFEYLKLYFPNDHWPQNGGKYGYDFKKLNDRGQYWDFYIVSFSNNENILLEIAEYINVPGNFDVILYDRDLQMARDMRTSQHYTIICQTEQKMLRKFRLYVGTPEYLKSNNLEQYLLPTVFDLSQNFPNPFNPVTTIKYSIPRKSKVSLKVFDLLGTVVKVLVNKEEDAGFYAISWDGTNQINRPVASGMYFYQMIAQDVKSMNKSYIQTKKLIYLK